MTKNGYKMHNLESTFQNFQGGRGIPHRPPSITRALWMHPSPDTLCRLHPPPKLLAISLFFTIYRPLDKALGHLKMHDLIPIFKKNTGGYAPGPHWIDQSYIIKKPTNHCQKRSTILQKGPQFHCAPPHFQRPSYATEVVLYVTDIGLTLGLWI